MVDEQLILPDEQIGNSAVQPRSQKYSASRFAQINSRSPAVSSHQEGRLAIVTNAGRDAMDADVLLTNSA
jgi:hypothetical protein